MAPHSSPLAWKVSWMEEPDRLQSMDGVAKSWTQLSDFPFTFHFHALEKEMAIQSSVLAWRIPRTGEPGGCFTSSLAHELFEDRELSMQQALNEYLLNTTPNFTGGFKQLRAESVDTELPYVTPDIEQLGLQDAIPVITPFICLTIDSRVVKPACLGPVFTRKQAVPMCIQTSSIQLSAWQHQFAPIQNPKQHKTSGRNVRPKECLANSENVRVKKDIDTYLFLKWNFPLYIQLSHHIDWQLICIPVKIQICYLIQDI